MCLRMENVHPRICQRMREAFQDHNRRLYELLEATAAGAPKEQPYFPPFRCCCVERESLLPERKRSLQLPGIVTVS